MQLTKKDVEEFKAIYRREFDTELTDAEALELGNAALTLFKAIYQPQADGTERQPLGRL
ncbi:MAG: hypothetical protein Q8P78_03145 [bacterium]|nr:hypothetical protein [bacterium]